MISRVATQFVRMHTRIQTTLYSDKGLTLPTFIGSSESGTSRPFSDSHQPSALCGRRKGFSFPLDFRHRCFLLFCGIFQHLLSDPLLFHYSINEKNSNPHFLQKWDKFVPVRNTIFFYAQYIFNSLLIYSPIPKLYFRGIL